MLRRTVTSSASSPTEPSRRRRAALSIVLALPLLAGSLLTAAPAALAAGDDDAARLAAAAELLGKQVRQFDEPTSGKVQWGYDFLLAFASAGDGTSPAQPGQAWNLLDSLEVRATISADDTTKSALTLSGKQVAAATSFDEITQLMHIAAVYGQDVTDFAGRNFVAALDGFRFRGGNPVVDATWYGTTTAATTRVTTVQQARAVLALSVAGRADAAAAAAMSLRAKQQSAGNNTVTGAWGSSYTASGLNVEATVNAVIALTAEGSPESVAAAQLGADVLISRQQSDGTFTSASTVILVGQLTNAIKGVATQSTDGAFQERANVAVAKSESWLRRMQLLDDSRVDALFNGAFLTATSDSAQMRTGTYDAVKFGYVSSPNRGLVENAFKGVLGLGRPVASLSLAEPVGPRPTVEGPYYTPTDGVCGAASGVTVIVDFGTSTETGVPQIVTRCVPGVQASAWAALRNAGFELGSDATQVATTAGPANKICEIDGVRASCGEGGAGAWYLWTADSDSADWKSANANPSNWAPKVGRIIGLRLASSSAKPQVDPPVEDDGTAPLITVTAGPEGQVVGSTSQTFRWTLDNTGPAVAYRLDKGPWVAHTSTSYTWTDISYGEHVFAVRATDIWGNFSTVERRFTLEPTPAAVPPVVEITSTPAKRTSSSRAEFKMSIDDKSARVKCRLDSDDPDEWLNCAPPVTGSPARSRTYTDLELGPHRFEYRAVNSVGSASASYEWEIAADAPPVVLISSEQDGYSNQNTAAVVSFQISTAAGEVVQDLQCRIDGGSWVACRDELPAVNTSVTVTLDAVLADGAHTLDVRATTKDSEDRVKVGDATYRWTVDTVAPVVTVPAVADGPRNHDSVAWQVSDTSPTKSVRCTLDGTTSPCVAPPYLFSGVRVGTHELSVTATDAAGNVSDEAITAWRITPSAAATVSSPVAGDITPWSLAISSDAVAGDLDATVEAELWQNGEVVDTQVQDVPAGSSKPLSYRFSNLKSSTVYQVRVIARDVNGVGAASTSLTIETLKAPATLGAPQVSARTASSATVSAAVKAGDLDAVVAAEVLLAGRVVKTAPAQPVGSGESATPSFSLTGLAADTSYQVRVVLTRADGETLTSSTVPLVTLAAPAKFATGVSATSVLAGRTVTVTAAGLKPGEPYQVELGGVVLARGNAGGTGTVSRQVTIPTATKQAKVALSVVGKQRDRTGQASLWVASKSAKLSVKVSSTSIKKSKTQKVTIAGLVPGEKLTIAIAGMKTKTAKASSSGTYTYKVKVGKKKGTKKVTVYGQVTTRVGKTSYKVK